MESTLHSVKLAGYQKKGKWVKLKSQVQVQVQVYGKKVFLSQ